MYIRYNNPSRVFETSDVVSKENEQSSEEFDIKERKMPYYEYAYNM